MGWVSAFQRFPCRGGAVARQYAANLCPSVFICGGTALFRFSRCLQVESTVLPLSPFRAPRQPINPVTPRIPLVYPSYTPRIPLVLAIGGVYEGLRRGLGGDIEPTTVLGDGLWRFGLVGRGARSVSRLVTPTAPAATPFACQPQPLLALAGAGSPNLASGALAQVSRPLPHQWPKR